MALLDGGRHRNVIETFLLFHQHHFHSRPRPPILRGLRSYLQAHVTSILRTEPLAEIATE